MTTRLSWQTLPWQPGQLFTPPPGFLIKASLLRNLFVSRLALLLTQNSL